jgi:hypothetical protein
MVSLYEQHGLLHNMPAPKVQLDGKGITACIPVSGDYFREGLVNWGAGGEGTVAGGTNFAHQLTWQYEIVSL